MKALFLYSSLLFLCISFSSCEDIYADDDMDFMQVMACDADVYAMPGDGYFQVRGLVKKLKFYIPVEGVDVGKNGMDPANMREVVKFLIIPARDESVMLEACNLPAGFQEDGLFIHFSGRLLRESPSDAPLQGITPFSLEEIAEEEDSNHC